MDKNDVLRSLMSCWVLADLRAGFATSLDNLSALTRGELHSLEFIAATTSETRYKLDYLTTLGGAKACPFLTVTSAVNILLPPAVCTVDMRQPSYGGLPAGWFKKLMRDCDVLATVQYIVGDYSLEGTLALIGEWSSETAKDDLESGYRHIFTAFIKSVYATGRYKIIVAHHDTRAGYILVVLTQGDVTHVLRYDVRYVNGVYHRRYHHHTDGK